MMELAMIILAIGIVFYMNKSDDVSYSKLKEVGKLIDAEFCKRDKKIESLENEIDYLRSELGLN